MADTRDALVAYFSMEAALDARAPTYSGGLGVLAGDTLAAAADIGVPMVGITLLHRRGYFHQHLGPDGRQSETPEHWEPQTLLVREAPTATIELDGRPVEIALWRYDVTGRDGAVVPVYFLDTELESNAPEHRALAGELYGDGEDYRLRQEAVLGLGGIAALRALGCERIQVHHLNEGHSALLGVALLEEQAAAHAHDLPTAEDLAGVRRQCVFTTHTPVPAGHDRFPLELVERVLGPRRGLVMRESGCCLAGELNMTHLGLHLARYVNGVAMRHGEISRGMFPGYPIASITNGVHALRWVSAPFRELFDRHVPQWRRDPMFLRYVISLDTGTIRSTHAQAKRALLERVERASGRRLDPGVFTIGFARRATRYKRADLVFSDVEWLRAIARRAGKLQILLAGKAHPRDEEGKRMIRRVFEAGRALDDDVPVVYLEDYGTELAASLVSGVDLWLNTPQKPQEASGTSGMKAALNGVPSLSVEDGWWIEGHLEGVTGWAIGDGWRTESDGPREAASLYAKLEHVILPLYYSNPDGYAEVRRSAIVLNGSFFNAHRMMRQYLENAYRLPLAGELSARSG